MKTYVQRYLYHFSYCRNLSMALSTFHRPLLSDDGCVQCSRSCAPPSPTSSNSSAIRCQRRCDLLLKNTGQSCYSIQLQLVVVFTNRFCCCSVAVHVYDPFIRSFMLVRFWIYRIIIGTNTTIRLAAHVCVWVFHFIPSKLKQFVHLNCYFLSTVSTHTLCSHWILSQTQFAHTHTHIQTCVRFLLLFHCTPFGCSHWRRKRVYTFNEK